MFQALQWLNSLFIESEASSLGLVLSCYRNWGFSFRSLKFKMEYVNFQNKTVTITGVRDTEHGSIGLVMSFIICLCRFPKKGERAFSFKQARCLNDALWKYWTILAKETGNTDFLKIHFHTFRHFAILWKYFKTKDVVETKRFAGHCNIQNTLRYVHLNKVTWLIP